MCKCVSKHTSVVTTGSPERPGIPRAMVYGCFVPSPVNRACLPPSSARLGANLTPASGSQDNTTWPSAFATVRYRRYRRPPHPAPRSVTIAKRPSVGRDDEGYSPRIFICQATFPRFRKKWERGAGDAALRQPQRMAFSRTMRRLGPAQAVEKSATGLNPRLRMHQKAATGALPWIERKS